MESNGEEVEIPLAIAISITSPYNNIQYIEAKYMPKKGEIL